MKKLNITKKQYDESKYFNKKYGALKYVSESGKMYKTDKGVVLALEGVEEKPVKEDDEEKKGEVSAEEGEVTRGELTEMLKDVVDAVKEVADSQDVPVDAVLGVETEEGEADEADADEVVATKEEVADVLTQVIDTVAQVADKAEVELPVEVVPAEDGDEDVDEEENEATCPDCKGGKCASECGAACECGDKKPVPKMESRKARIQKVRESIQRKIRAKKVMESIKAHRRAKKVLESAKRRARIRKIMESRKARKLAK